MPEAKFDDPAILAIEQAKYTLNELIEESREKLRGLEVAANRAEKALQTAVAERDRQATLHNGLNQRMVSLNQSKRTLEKAAEEQEREAL